MGNAQVPLTVALVAYMIKVFLSTTCSPWSNTCRSTSDFFSSLVVVTREGREAYAFIIISIGLANYKKLNKLMSSLLGVFQILNNGGKD